MRCFALVLVIVSAFALAADANPDKMVCYFSSWATYRPQPGKYDVENIDPFLCTHIVYAFIGINADGTVRIMDPWNDLDLGAFVRFTNLRMVNPNLKPMVGIGGWNEGSQVFSDVMKNPDLRRRFTQSVFDFLKQYGFVGLDLDWEYPGQRGGAPEDKENYVLMMQELKQLFEPSGYLLTAAVSASIQSIDISYNVPALNQYLDFINLMTYDYHGGWDYSTGHNSPLYPNAADVDQTWNVNSSVLAWIKYGATPSKIILGMPTYGRTFTLVNAEDPAIGAGTMGPGQAGPYTGEEGYMGYNEICEKQLESQWVVTWDPQSKVPYMSQYNQWCSYDDQQSIVIKANYAVEMGLGGAMVWSLETDDFHNNCGTGTNVLITTIKNTFMKKQIRRRGE